MLELYILWATPGLSVAGLTSLQIERTLRTARTILKVLTIPFSRFDARVRVGLVGWARTSGGSKDTMRKAQRAGRKSKVDVAQWTVQMTRKMPIWRRMVLQVRPGTSRLLSMRGVLYRLTNSQGSLFTNCNGCSSETLTARKPNAKSSERNRKQLASQRPSPAESQHSLARSYNATNARLPLNRLPACLETYSTPPTVDDYQDTLKGRLTLVNAR